MSTKIAKLQELNRCLRAAAIAKELNDVDREVVGVVCSTEAFYTARNCMILQDATAMRGFIINRNYRQGCSLLEGLLEKQS